MATPITALNIKLRMDTRAVAAGSNQVRKDVAAVNAIVRKARTDTQRYEEAAAALTRRLEAGALTTKKYKQLLAEVHQQYITGPQRIAAEKAAIEAANEAKRKAAIIERQRADAARAAAAEEQRIATIRRSVMPLVERSRTDAERYAANLRNLKKALREGAIGTEEFRRGMQVLRADMRQNTAATGSFNRLGSAFSFLNPQIIAATAAMGAFYGVVSAVQDSIKLAASLEEAAIQFEVLAGNADDSEKLLKDMRELANTTALTFDGLQNNAKTMLAFGVATDKVIPSLKQIGDITAGDTERMKSMSLAFSQVAAAGKLTGQDLLQMVNAGFNPLQEISKKTGISMLDLKKRMEEGQISSELVAMAFESATSEGGRFNNMLEASKGTLSGQYRLLQSDIEKLKTQLGEELLPVVSDLVKEFRAMMDVGGLKTLISYTAELVEVVDMLNRATNIYAATVGMWRDYSSFMAGVANAAPFAGDALTAQFNQVVDFNKAMTESLKIAQEKQKATKSDNKAIMDNVRALIEEDKRNAEAIKRLREAGRQLQEKYNPVMVVGRQLGELMMLLQGGFIDVDTFMQERNQILADSMKAQEALIQPDELTFGSKEAADFVQKQMFDAANQQLEKMEQQRLLQKAQLDAQREANRLLAEIPPIRKAR